MCHWIWEDRQWNRTGKGEEMGATLDVGGERYRNVEMPQVFPVADALGAPLIKAHREKAEATENFTRQPSWMLGRRELAQHVQLFRLLFAGSGSSRELCRTDESIPPQSLTNEKSFVNRVDWPAATLSRELKRERERERERGE